MAASKEVNAAVIITPGCRDELPLSGLSQAARRNDGRLIGWNKLEQVGKRDWQLGLATELIIKLATRFSAQLKMERLF